MSTQTTTKQPVKHFLDSVEEGYTEVDPNTQSLEVTNNAASLLEDELTDEEKEALEKERLALEQQDDEGNQEEDNENDDTSNQQEESVEFTFGPFAQELIDSDVLLLDDTKEYDDDVVGFKEMVDDTVRFKVEEYKNSFKNPATSKFIEFLENGGSPDEFIQSSSEIADYANYDLTDAETQKNLIRDNMILQGYEQADIEEEIESFEEINTLEKHARIAQKKLVKYAEEKMLEITNQQKAKEQERVNKLNSELLEIKQTIFDKPDIAGFKPSKSEREKFYEYMTKPVAKDKEGNLLTKYMVEMQEEDKVKMAYFKFKKFNFSDIESKVESKKAGELHKFLKLKNDKLTSKNNLLPGQGEEENKKIDIPWIPLG